MKVFVCVVLACVGMAAAASGVQSVAPSVQSNAAVEMVTYVDSLAAWWPPSAVAGSLGVPQFATVPDNYTVINLSFWTTSGPVDAALVWADLLKYMSSANPWNEKTTSGLQSALLQQYHAAGIKLCVSAFGATDQPTTGGADPVATAEALGKFVTENSLDCVDVDYEDNSAMNAGKGEAWLITFTQHLAANIPAGVFITHAPQAPYFMGVDHYPGGGYMKVFTEVGHLIEFFSIQFYNQQASAYATYETLFVEADGWATNTAVAQIHALGVPYSMIVVGKPATQAAAANTGYVPVGTLAPFFCQAKSAGYTVRGVMNWQYLEDVRTLHGAWVPTLAKCI